MTMMRYGVLAVLLAVSGVISTEILAQDNTETERIEALREMVKSESFNVSGLIHARGIFNFDENGVRSFSVPHARIKVDGKLDNGFSYNVHFDAAASSTVLDAFIGYEISDKANVSVGIQKPGVSYEFLTAPHKIDFVTRSTIVAALTQNRDIGVRFHGNLSDELGYSAGVYNGNRYGANDNNKFFYAGRLAYNSTLEDGKLIFGVNASYGEQSDAPVSSAVLPNIDGKRFTYGGDLRFENSRIILASEVLAADLEYTGFAEEDNVFGYHLTGGYKVSERSQVLVRYDSFDSDLLGSFAPQDHVIVGFTHFPTSQTGFRVNYIIPADNSDFSNHGLALNYHISF